MSAVQRVPRELRCPWCRGGVMWPQRGLYDEVVYEDTRADGTRRSVQRRVDALRYRCRACGYHELYTYADLRRLLGR